MEDELDIIESMIKNAFPNLKFETFIISGDWELLVMLPPKTKEEIYKKLLRLEELELEDYENVVVTRGTFFSEIKSKGIDIYYLYDMITYLYSYILDGYTEYVDDPGEEIITEDPFRYVDDVWAVYRETGWILNEDVVKCKGECIVINDTDSFYYFNVYPMSELTKVYETYTKKVYYHEKNDLLIFVDRDKPLIKVIDSLVELPTSIYLDDIIRRLPEGSYYRDIDEEDLMLMIIREHLCADRVALINPYTLEVIKVVSYKGVCVPKSKIRFNPERRKFVWENGHEQSCPPPIV